MIPVKKHLSTDVLVVGGGIAGLSAAISARASGVGVLIAEKANTSAAAPALRATITFSAISRKSTGRTSASS